MTRLWSGQRPTRVRIWCGSEGYLIRFLYRTSWAFVNVVGEYTVWKEFTPVRDSRPFKMRGYLYTPDDVVWWARLPDVIQHAVVDVYCRVWYIDKPKRWL